MGPFDLFDAILGPINPISRVLGGISAVRHANFRRAADEGTMSVVGEIAGGLVGATAFQFAIPRDGNHTLDDVQALLRRYGVPTFTLLHDHENFYFSVKRTQARWAEYVLQNAGVDLRNAAYDRQNAVLASSHAPGWMPRPWSEQDRSTADHTARSSAAGPHSQVQAASGVEAIFLRAESIILGEHQRDHNAEIAIPGESAAGRTRSQLGWLDQLDSLVDRFLD